MGLRGPFFSPLHTVFYYPHYLAVTLFSSTRFQAEESRTPKCFDWVRSSGLGVTMNLLDLF